MGQSLNSWSWGSIIKTYRLLGGQLQEYQGLNQRIHIPKNINFEYDDHTNVLIIHFWRDVNRLNEQLGCLDKEIARRNNLIGVMG